MVWQPEEVTRIASTLLKKRQREQPSARLLLKYHDNRLDLDQSTGTVILGRGHKADMVVNDTMASREHARIECRRGKFFVTDQSTNGTYVETAGGVAFLRREEMQMSGEGRIALGRSPVDATEVVHFRLES